MFSSTFSESFGGNCTNEQRNRSVQHCPGCCCKAYSRQWALKKSQRQRNRRGKIPLLKDLIGSIRRECLDHLILLGKGQRRRILREYFGYYNEARPQQSLEELAAAKTMIERRTEVRISGVCPMNALITASNINLTIPCAVILSARQRSTQG